MSTSFVRTFEEARSGISLPKLAEAMAGRTGKSASGLSGNLYRLMNQSQTPKRETVVDIAETLGSLRNLSTRETDRLRKRLMSAAHPENLRAAAKLEVSESEERNRLRASCHRALQTVHTLKERDIERIVDHVGISTMKLIIAAAKKGEEIEVVQLQKISEELQQTARGYLGAAEADAPNEADTVIGAGRARILIHGDVSPAQMQVLKNAAEMIKSVLKL